jgi:hypothetical protein
MASTEFLNSRKAKIIIGGSIVIGVVGPLPKWFLARLNPPSSPNPWDPYFREARTIAFRPVSVFVYLAVCATILFWASRPPVKQEQENTKLTVIAIMVVSIECFLLSWILGV